MEKAQKKIVEYTLETKTQKTQRTTHVFPKNKSQKVDHNILSTNLTFLSTRSVCPLELSTEIIIYILCECWRLQETYARVCVCKDIATNVIFFASYIEFCACKRSLLVSIFMKALNLYLDTRQPTFI